MSDDLYDVNRRILSDIKNDIDYRTQMMLSDLQELNEREFSKADIESGPVFAARQEEIITRIFKEAVDDFYSAYDRKYYDSDHEGLYAILDIKTFDDGGGAQVVYEDVSDLYDPNSAFGDPSRSYHGQPLFDKVFMEGWHGGAESGPGHPASGTPYYRAPVDHWTHWSTKAVKTTSPNKLFERSLVKAEGGEIFQEFCRISDLYGDEAYERVSEQIPELIDKYFY